MSEHTENQVSENPAGEFGRLLRTQRERRGLSIGEVAERLKLSAKQIEAFEAGNYESMPESVFVRGFLRTYGRFLELDDELVSSYLDRIMPGSAVRSRAAEADRQGTLNFQNQKTGRQFPTWIFGLLVIIAIGAGVYAWQGKSREENSKQTTASEAGAGLEQVAAPNIDTTNVSVVPMPAAASAASQVEETADTGAAAGELLLKTRYRSMLVVKDKTGKELLHRIVPANSEHRFSGGAPYQVSIGIAKGAQAAYGSQVINLSEHMQDKKTASFSVGN
ncbi:Cytoskeleton protein rodZ [Kingella potus]|uniref:Cytoskeleton protein rodZ n=1 Tax=Kingella potus TaxID=265175 RepID=A0A377R1R6_9NEIS|nr:helix-turn-helix domain-containing protein [Kingella potus]STR02820.1 Cytoskeleton protein rodZ [Kingella potus]